MERSHLLFFMYDMGVHISCGEGRELFKVISSVCPNSPTIMVSTYIWQMRLQEVKKLSQAAQSIGQCDYRDLFLTSLCFRTIFYSYTQVGRQAQKEEKVILKIACIFEAYGYLPWLYEWIFDAWFVLTTREMQDTARWDDVSPTLSKGGLHPWC